MTITPLHDQAGRRSIAGVLEPAGAVTTSCLWHPGEGLRILALRHGC